MRPRDAILATLVVAIWSSNFIAGKICLETAPPIFIAFLRFTFTALALLPFVRLPKVHIKPVFLLTLTLGLMHFALIMVALKDLEASTSAIGIQCGVPFSMILSAIFLKERVTKRQITGILVAFGGILILMGEPNIFGNPFAFFLLITAAFFWGVSNLQTRALKDLNPFTLNAYFSLFLAPQLLALTWIFEENPLVSLSHINGNFILSVAYMVLFTTIVAYTLWYKLLGKYSISLVAPFNLLGPLFGVILSWLVLGESVGIMKLIGGAVIISGVGLIVFQKKPVVLK